MNNQSKHIRKLIATIPDPEIPVLTIEDLGVIRDVALVAGVYEITITPTYSGCPAMNVFEDDIIALLKENHIENAKVVMTYDPPWTTDWLTESAKMKLQQYGIAPPEEKTSDKNYIAGKERSNVTCPQCKSQNTKMISQFGSTACKALYQCSDCKEPFDYFKCL